MCVEGSASQTATAVLRSFKYFAERMAHLEKSRGVLAEDLGAVHDLLATGLRDKVGTEVFGLVHCPEV